MQALNTTSLTLQDNRLWILDQQAPAAGKAVAPPRQRGRVGRAHSQPAGARRAADRLSASLLLALLAERGLPRAGLEQALHTLPRCARRRRST